MRLQIRSRCRTAGPRCSKARSTATGGRPSSSVRRRRVSGRRRACIGCYCDRRGACCGLSGSRLSTRRLRRVCLCGARFRRLVHVLEITHREIDGFAEGELFAGQAPRRPDRDSGEPHCAGVRELLVVGFERSISSPQVPICAQVSSRPMSFVCDSNSRMSFSDTRSMSAASYVLPASENFIAALSCSWRCDPRRFRAPRRFPSALRLCLPRTAG
jgi:hypothetical protein